MDTLLPCPFCGSPAVLRTDVTPPAVICNGDFCCARTSWDTAGDAIEMWQQRADTTTQRRIERMEWALRAIAREASAPNATGAADRFQAIARAALQEAE